MKKNYVLDTNVLLHDPRAIFRFEDNDVIIPIYVIEEVDSVQARGLRARAQRAPDRAAPRRAARTRAARSPGACRSTSGGTLRVAVPAERPELAERASTRAAMDQAILQTAFDVREQRRRAPDHLRDDGHQPPHPRRRARDGRRRTTRTSASRSTSSTTGMRRARRRRQRDRRVLPRRRASPRATPALRAATRCVLLARPNEPVAHGARPVRRRQAQVIARSARRARA